LNFKRTNKVNLDWVWIFLFSRRCPTPLIFIPERILGIFHFIPEESCPSRPDRFVHVFIRVENIFSQNFGFNFRFVGFENSNFSYPKIYFCVFTRKTWLIISKKFRNFTFFCIFFVISDDLFDIDHVTKTFDLCKCHFLMLVEMPSTPHRNGLSCWNIVLEI